MKVIVRLLPPEITEEEFTATISQQQKRDIKWTHFFTGKRFGEAKPALNARCNFQFQTSTQAEEFISEYHGRAFVDGQGESFRAVACFAPYQKVPRTTQKDTREATIEDDPIYQEFAEGLKGKKEYEPPLDPKSFKPTDYGDTPLLNFMKTRAIERKTRWEKRQSNKKNWYGMESVEENPKRNKWCCSECGATKNLEEDPDNRGTFYCTYCWESWEVADVAPKVKKKKKKAKEEAVWEEEEEVEETTSKKKKKKKKDKEREKEEPEWRAKDQSASWSEYTYEGEATESGSRRKKKKEKAEAVAYEEESSSKWRVKKPEEEEWAAHEWSEDRSSKRKGKKESKEADWWAEEAAGKASKSSKHKEDAWWEGAWDEKAASKSGTKWKAKGEEESGGGGEKPRRGKKDKAAEGESGGYWAPKSSKSSW